MITKTQQAAIDLYQGLMEEVKLRIRSVELAISGLLTFHPFIIREFAYLQLRMICELIALGCLTAHGDLPGASSKNLRKAWSADEIIKALELLHPDFYPHPVKQVVYPTHHVLEPVTSGFLTKDELLSLNGKCGDIVHRGSVKKLLTGPISVEATHPDAAEWLGKIKTLLGVHRIGLKGGSSHVICVLSAELAKGAAQVAFAEAALPPSDVLEAVARAHQPE